MGKKGYIYRGILTKWWSHAGDMDLDSAILDALLKEGGTTVYRQLELSLSWNRTDLARDKVSTRFLRGVNHSLEIPRNPYDKSEISYA